MYECLYIKVGIALRLRSLYIFFKFGKYGENMIAAKTPRYGCVNNSGVVIIGYEMGRYIMQQSTICIDFLRMYIVVCFFVAEVI